MHATPRLRVCAFFLSGGAARDNEEAMVVTKCTNLSVSISADSAFCFAGGAAEADCFRYTLAALYLLRLLCAKLEQAAVVSHVCSLSLVLLAVGTNHRRTVRFQPDVCLLQYFRHLI